MKNVFFTCLLGISFLSTTRAMETPKRPKVSKFVKIISLLESAMNGTMQFEEKYAFCPCYNNNQMQLQISNNKFTKLAGITASCIAQSLELVPSGEMIKAKLALLPHGKDTEYDEDPYSLFSEHDILQIQIKRFYDFKHTCEDRDTILQQLECFKESNKDTFNVLFDGSMEKAIEYLIQWQAVCDSFILGYYDTAKPLNDCMTALKEFPIQSLKDALCLYLRENPGFSNKKKPCFPTHFYDTY